MNMSNEDYKKESKSKNILGIFSIIFSGIALLISGLVAYNTALKSFDLAIRIDPAIQIQHKGNFGIYLDVNFFNRSPKNGLITQLAVILYRTNSIEDKYLLSLSSFRVLNQDGVTYGYSQDRLPIFLQPWQRNNKVASFIYQTEDDFPISMGTYVCELLAWTDDGSKPKYIKEIKFEITADILNRYLERRKAGSVTLEPANVIGYTSLKARKLTVEEYKQLH